MCINFYSMCLRSAENAIGILELYGFCCSLSFETECFCVLSKEGVRVQQWFSLGHPSPRTFGSIWRQVSLAQLGGGMLPASSVSGPGKLLKMPDAPHALATTE